MQHQPRFVGFTALDVILLSFLFRLLPYTLPTPARKIQSVFQAHHSPSAGSSILYPAWRIELVVFAFTDGRSDSVSLALLEDSKCWLCQAVFGTLSPNGRPSNYA